MGRDELRRAGVTYSVISFGIAMNDEFDGPWKEGFDALLPAFFALCLPLVDEEMDWQRGYRTLDGEVRKILSESKTGKRHVDRLYQAWLRNGAEARIFIHMEVQSQQEEIFRVE
ncbi:MAG: hypothetical protein EXS16_22035 [Gemmataceae bacterium]|nr:hypothetical protein [Gemmataceae bacterium]